MSNAGGIRKLGAHLDGSSLARFIPEPKTSAALSFGGVFKSLASTVTGAAGNLAGISPEYADLINKQIEVQTQMQLVSMQSNLAKSKHETEMAPIRNIRVG